MALEHLKDSFFYVPDDQEVDALAHLSPVQFREKVYAYLEEDLADKERQVGHDPLNFFIRAEYLRRIDTLWQEHLESMEELRDAVYLRAYAQKNPLLEYKVEGFQQFDKLIEEIKTGIAKKMFKIRIQQAPSAPVVRDRVPAQIKQTHVSLGNYGAQSQQGERKEARATTSPSSGPSPRWAGTTPAPAAAARNTSCATAASYPRPGAHGGIFRPGPGLRRRGAGLDLGGSCRGSGRNGVHRHRDGETSPGLLSGRRFALSHAGAFGRLGD